MKRAYAIILTITLSLCALSHSAAAAYRGYHNFFFKQVHTLRPVISPDGKYIAIAGDNKVKIWNTLGKQVGEFIDPKPYINPPNAFKYWSPNRYIYALTFLPNSKQLAVSVFQRTVHILDLSGKIVKTIKVKRKKMRPGSSWSTITKIAYFPNGKRLVTFEPEQEDLVIRNSNYKLIKRVQLHEGSLSVTFSDIQIDSKGKYIVVVQSPATPSKDDWNTYIRLYSTNGKFIRDLATDKPGRIRTPLGKFKKAILSPDRVTFSPNGKRIVFINKHLRVSNKDPMGRTQKNDRGRDVKVHIEKRIRTVEIASGKEFEVWVTDPRNVHIKHVDFAKNGKSFIGFGEEAIYRISPKGEVTDIISHEKTIKKTTRKTYEIPFKASYYTFNKRSGKVAAYSYRDLLVYNLKGKKLAHIKSNAVKTKSISLSHSGEFIALELDKGKKSLLFNTKKGRVTLEKASIYFDKRNRQQRLAHSYSKERKSKINTITMKGKKEIYSEGEYRLFYIRILPSNQFADTYNGMTLFDAEGEAVRRYKKTELKNETAIDPKLKFYIHPNTWPKYKTIHIKNMRGKKLREIYLGANFSFAYGLAPNGQIFAAGHDKTGYVQVWSVRGKMLHRFSDLHATQVIDVELTKNGRYMVSAESDGTIMVTDLKKKKRRLMISIYESGSFIATDNKGRYDCSKNMKNIVSVAEKGNIKSKSKTSGLVWKFFKGK